MARSNKGQKGTGWEYGGKREGMPGYHHHSIHGNNWVKRQTNKRSRQSWSHRGNEFARG